MIARTHLFAVSYWRIALAFILLFMLYQSAEGVGARWLGNAAVQGALMVLTVVAAWPVGRWLLGWRGYAAYALQWHSGVPLWIATGLLLSFAGKAIAIIVGLRIGAYSHAVEPVVALSLAGLGFVLLSTFIASIAEDIITRGFWWRVGFVSKTQIRFIFGTAAIYVLNHIFRLSNGPAEWFMLFCLGIAYATAVARTGSLWAAVGLHWGWNLSNALVDHLVSLDAHTAITPYLSGVTNLCIAVVILVLPRRWASPDRTSSQPA